MDFPRNDTLEPALPENTQGRRSLSFGVRIGLALLAGLFLALSFPPYSLPVALLPGIVLLLLALRGAGVRHAAYAGLACGLVYFGGTLFWLANLFGAAAVSLVAIAALFPMLFAVGLVWLRKRLSLPYWLLAPLVWTACEYFRSEPFVLNFGWVGLGYGVVGTAFWAGIASVVGSYGVSFVLVSLAAVCTLQSKPALLIRIAVGLLYLLSFVVPPAHITIERPLSVHLVQAFSDDTDSFFANSTPERVQSASVIVWPEYSINDDPTRNARLWERLRQVAVQNNAYFVFGGKAIPDPHEDAFRNTAYVLDPQGSMIARHVKNHLVHFIKDGMPGTTAKAVPTSLGRLGIAICFDMDYPDVARRLADDGAEVFLVPNMDPSEWGTVQRAQHRLMFQMRAVECGRWLARADVAGGTSVCAPNGQVVAAVTTSEPTTLHTSVGRTTGKTLYLRGGWRFGQVCLLGTVLLLLWSWLPRRHS